MILGNVRSASSAKIVRHEISLESLSANKDVGEHHMRCWPDMATLRTGEKLPREIATRAAADSHVSLINISQDWA